MTLKILRASPLLVQVAESNSLFGDSHRFAKPRPISIEKLFLPKSSNIPELREFLGYNFDLSFQTTGQLIDKQRISKIFEMTCLQIIKAYLKDFKLKKKSFDSFAYEITNGYIIIESDDFLIRAKY